MLTEMFAKLSAYANAEIAASGEEYELLEKLNKHAGKKVSGEHTMQAMAQHTTVNAAASVGVAVLDSSQYLWRWTLSVVPYRCPALRCFQCVLCCTWLCSFFQYEHMADQAVKLVSAIQTVNATQASLDAFFGQIDALELNLTELEAVVAQLHLNSKRLHYTFQQVYSK
jgi:hypothetical protein